MYYVSTGNIFCTPQQLLALRVLRKQGSLRTDPTRLCDAAKQTANFSRTKGETRVFILRNTCLVFRFVGLRS